MNEQTTMELNQGEAYARATDPGTSHAAARDMRGEEANRREKTVLYAIRNSTEGLTNHEIVRLTGLNWNTASTRIAPLRRKGLVKNSGLKRPGPSGKQCIVWQAV